MLTWVGAECLPLWSRLVSASILAALLTAWTSPFTINPSPCYAASNDGKTMFVLLSASWALSNRFLQLWLSMANWGPAHSFFQEKGCFNLGGRGQIHQFKMPVPKASLRQLLEQTLDTGNLRDRFYLWIGSDWRCDFRSEYLHLLVSTAFIGFEVRVAALRWQFENGMSLGTIKSWPVMRGASYRGTSRDEGRLVMRDD